MTDFRSTAKAFAKAKLGASLPLDTIDARQQRRGQGRHARQQRRAQRANCMFEARGRLLFSSTVDDPQPKPLAHARVELWDRDFASPDDYLGTATSDIEGRFVIDYDPDDAGPHDNPDLELRVFDVADGAKTLIAVIEGANEIIEQRYDFGDVPVPFYEYHPEIRLPHVLALTLGREKLDSIPQAYAIGRKMALAQIASRVLGIRLRHYLLGKGRHLERIQADYRRRVPYTPCVSLGADASPDERFVDKLLNGACPTKFTRDAEGRLHVVRNWDAYEMDGRHYLPNIHAEFDYDGAVLRPRSITIQARRANAREPHAPLATPEIHRPGEPGWAEAKHVFECNNYMYTQVANHLARAHFNVEQFALAAFRNLRQSPLRALLFPHLKEVMLINVEGERAIFGPEGLLTTNGALTENSLAQAIEDHACIDWYGWRPREPLTAGHRFARISSLYWEVLTGYVDRFFAAEIGQIVAHWDEARSFSDELVAHSVAYAPLPLLEGHGWRDDGEEAKPGAPRVEVGGVRRVVTPIVTSAEVSEAQLLNLAQACAYVIYHATFFHSWVNDTSDALEDSYAQYNPVSQSTAKELSDHISMNLALSQTRYGLLTRNEDGDVPAEFIDALIARAEEFAEQQFDVRQIRSRINI